MRCDAVRQVVEEGMDKLPGIQSHLASCSACKEYLRQWERVHAALVALQEEEPPEPSIGFTTRLIRRLENASEEPQVGQQFMDQIGRRVVYATLMVAIMLLLVLVLPSSGPLRSSGVSESVLVQAQVATLSSEQILGVDGIDSGDVSESAPAPSTVRSPVGRGSK